MKKALLSTAFLVGITVGPLQAQTPAVEFGAFGGLYVPATDVLEVDQQLLAAVEQLFFDEFGATLDLDNFSAKHKAGFLVGGRVGVWFTEVFGLEGSFAFALSDLQDELSGTLDGVPFDEQVDEDASVWFASVKGLYQFGMPGSPVMLHVGAGPALIGHGGDAYDGLDGTTDLGGVLNAGVAIGVSDQVAIRIDIDDYLYSAQFDIEGTDLGDSKFQNDIQITGGVAIKLGPAGM